eukprot:5413094-Pyramimonas_sp.AAC.1
MFRSEHAPGHDGPPRVLVGTWACASASVERHGPLSQRHPAYWGPRARPQSGPMAMPLHPPSMFPICP